MTTYALNEDYRAKTRYYLGYFNLANRFILSSNQPVATAQNQVLEENMRNILDQASLDICVDVVDRITAIRCKIKEAKDRLSVQEIAYAVKMNNNEIEKLWNEDYRWCEQLAHLLAVPLYWHPTGRGMLGGNGTDVPIIYSR